MNFKQKAFKRVYICLVLSVFIVFCSRNPSPSPPETLLVRIRDKTISLNEFIMRSEYTPRPSFCKNNQMIDKKIILNSLIAEKLLALEAGDTCALIKKPHFKRYIEGRKEQAMRQWLLQQEGYSRVQSDTLQLQTLIQNSSRRYQVRYFSVKNDSAAHWINTQLHYNHVPFETLYTKISYNDTIPFREIIFNRNENEEILNELFRTRHQVNDIIGPIQTEENFYVTMKIIGWIESPAITDTEIRIRNKDASDFLTDHDALSYYQKFVASLMKEKIITFVPASFVELTNFLGPFYLNNDTQLHKNLFTQSVFGTDFTKTNSDQIQKKIIAIRNFPLFTLNGTIWTIGDLETKIESHPLVFRKKHMKSTEFGEQLKFAIVDLVRDHFLAEEASRRGYDQTEFVKRSVSMWQDALVSSFFKHDYLKAMNSQDSLSDLIVIEKYLNPYIQNLQKKYSAEIFINVDEFNKISLTGIDMMAIQNNQPFSIMVPSFPVLTTSHPLDYGKKLTP